MKKVLFAALLLLLTSKVKAAGLWDQIDAAFVGNAKIATEFTTEGKTIVEFLDNFTEIGHIYKGDHIAALDLGGQGEIDSETGHFNGVAWTTGGKIHLAPFIRNTMQLTPEWQFLNTIEVDARGAYNWTEHHPQYALSIAYPFK